MPDAPVWSHTWWSTPVMRQAGRGAPDLPVTLPPHARLGQPGPLCPSPKHPNTPSWLIPHPAHADEDHVVVAPPVAKKRHKQFQFAQSVSMKDGDGDKDAGPTAAGPARTLSQRNMLRKVRGRPARRTRRAAAAAAARMHMRSSVCWAFLVCPVLVWLIAVVRLTTRATQGPHSPAPFLPCCSQRPPGATPACVLSAVHCRRPAWAAAS